MRLPADANITKVKWRTSTMKMTVHWDEPANIGETTTKRTSDERPHPDLFEALNALKPHLLKILELPEDYGAGLRITGFSITHHDEKPLEIVVTGLKELASGHKAALNTPLAEPTAGAWEALDDVFEETRSYIAGKRQQETLFEQDLTDVSDEQQN